MDDELIDDLSRQEESLIEAAAAEGIDLLRRADAAPMAVLSVIVGKRAAAAA
jgi:hypothetical protein